MIEIVWFSLKLFAYQMQQVMYGCSFQIINTDLPKYLNDVLHVSINDNGLYSSIPRILSVFVSIGSGIVADILQHRLNIDRTNVRKLFVILSKHWTQAHERNYRSWTFTILFDFIVQFGSVYNTGNIFNVCLVRWLRWAFGCYISHNCDKWSWI